MAYIYIESKTDTSVVLVIDALDDEWGNGTRTTAWYIGKGYIPSDTNFDFFKRGDDIEDYAMAGGRVEFSSLESDTQYYVLCEIWNGSDRIDVIDGEFTTDSDNQPLHIEKWDWSATAERSQAWLSLILPSLYPIDPNFSHNVWNDLVKKVQDLIDATYLYWIGDYGSYEDTKMTLEPYELTADKFNALRNNLDFVCINRGIDNTGIGRVYSLDKNYPVLAGYFLTIANYINKCIDGY